ncbi:MAG: T9SS type A sorting domain-containing protein, partial [bacterium]
VDASLADALAASKDFGVVVFGNKGPGSSSTNSSSPRFDPTQGETLKVIPPQSSGATIKVFSLKDELVFEESSLTGQEVEWDGSDLNGSLVSTGVYVVKVTSGNKTKTFPVAVAK